MSYGATILTESGFNWNANKSTIFMSFVMLFGTICYSMLTDIVGRKILVTLSITGCSLGFVGLGTYSYYYGFIENLIVSSMNWIPVLCLSIITFSASFGIFGMPHVIIAETLPEKVTLFTARLMICNPKFFWLFFFCRYVRWVR